MRPIAYQAAAGMPGAVGEYYPEPTAQNLGELVAYDVATHGLGQTLRTVSIDRGRRKLMANLSPLFGLGESFEPITGGEVLAGIVGIGVRGVAGYFAGKAMAPRAESETKYAVGGVFAAIFLGAAGLGIEAGIALANRK